MGLITENHGQYYSGIQRFIQSSDAAGFTMTTTFDTDLVFFSSDPSNVDYHKNNFKLYRLEFANLGTEPVEYVDQYSVSNNVITVVDDLDAGIYYVQLKSIDGGSVGNKKAFGTAVDDNHGKYAYITLDDIINNFEVAYVGEDKLIEKVKRTDIMFHAKRGLQEFSYDILKSVKSMELNVGPSLKAIIPQDYVNYVKISSIDNSGVKRTVYPVNNLSINTTENFLQKNSGEFMYDDNGEAINHSSVTVDRFNHMKHGNTIDEDAFREMRYDGYGQKFGLEPQYAQSNGYFSINKSNISFSSNLAGKLIVIEYISDGLATDGETKVPKMAEDAIYAYISHAILSIRSNQPEYIINRLRREKTAKIANTKIRLSNIKLSEITQVFRGKSKILK